MKVKELIEQLMKVDMTAEVVLYLKYEEEASSIRNGVRIIPNNSDEFPYVKTDFPKVSGNNIVIIS